MVSVTPPAFGAEQVVTLDPEATEVSFLLDATGHEVQGTLFLESGEIRFDLETGVASGELIIEAWRAETGNKKRDKTMHRKVLESDRYPLFVFEASEVAGSLVEGETSEIDLAGTLAIHGGEHPFSIPLEIESEAGEIRAQATVTVPYVEWGMKRPNVLFLKVAPTVEVTVEAKGSISNPGALSPGS